MIPVGTLVSIASGVLKGVMEWLNSAAGNMFKGWIKGRKDQQRVDTIKNLEESVEQHERVEEARGRVPDRSLGEFNDWLSRGTRRK